MSDNNYYRITEEDLARFHEVGYLLVEQCFDEEEVELLRNVAKLDAERLKAGATDRIDAGGLSTLLTVCDELSDDMYSAIVQCRRIADTAEALLGEETYNWHHKLILKEPRVGGAWEWHQDYGYWYNDACLRPDLLSCSIAIDPSTRENGCLQVVPGSHHLGRINHNDKGKQTGADLTRVEAILGQLPIEHIEMQPGAALFFHANLLHCSDQNRSEHARWSLICCYNTRRNSPYKPTRHPQYSPLERWHDDRVREVGQRQLRELQPSG